MNNYLKDDQCLFVIYDYDYVKDPQARLTSKARRLSTSLRFPVLATRQGEQMGESDAGRYLKV